MPKELQKKRASDPAPTLKKKPPESTAGLAVNYKPKVIATPPEKLRFEDAKLVEPRKGGKW